MQKSKLCARVPQTGKLHKHDDHMSNARLILSVHRIIKIASFLRLRRFTYQDRSCDWQLWAASQPIAYILMKFFSKRIARNGPFNKTL